MKFMPLSLLSNVCPLIAQNQSLLNQTDATCCENFPFKSLVAIEYLLTQAWILNLSLTTSQKIPVTQMTGFLSQKDAEKIVRPFIFRRLDYSNGLRIQ